MVERITHTTCSVSMLLVVWWRHQNAWRMSDVSNLKFFLGMVHPPISAMLFRMRVFYLSATYVSAKKQNVSFNVQNWKLNSMQEVKLINHRNTPPTGLWNMGFNLLVVGNNFRCTRFLDSQFLSKVIHNCEDVIH